MRNLFEKFPTFLKKENVLDKAKERDILIMYPRLIKEKKR